MKISKHICFFYIEERVKYINTIIKEVNQYPHQTDLFIHCNKELDSNIFETNENGKLEVIVHTNFKDNNPFYLSWKPRELLKKQRYDYDAFIYIEDDILIYKDTLEYWINYKDKLTKYNLNLGFIRIEMDENNEKYWVNIANLSNVIIIDNEKYLLNNISTYSAFWIYDQKEFNRWVDSDYWNIENIKSINQMYIREVSAIGFTNEGYKATVMPLQKNKLHGNCEVHHLTNKFHKDNTTPFGKIKVKDIYTHKIQYISLGGWCGTTISLRQNQLYEDAYPFDHVRSTFIGIIDCIENNFSNFFPKKIELDPITVDYQWRSFRGKYFGFYHHDLTNTSIVNNFIKRINRFYNLLSSTTEEIVFLRTIATHDYNDEIKLTNMFITSIEKRFPSLRFILIFIIPRQDKSMYFKKVNNKTFIFTLDDNTNNNDMLGKEYKPIYDFISQHDLFHTIPNDSEIEVKNGYNRFAEVDGVKITREDN
jgi:hypothetical protein